ncbi:MAG: glycogen phosphorylase [Acetobacteraceae bacterium]|nr:glycogen/starch/alpha-glucan phosphorylase [Rhodopila sp.]MEA2731829.1 glycogen phosphorylase [Acetobacteraceae bacterium]
MAFETDMSANYAGNADSHDPVRNDEEIAALQTAILEKLTYHVGKRRAIATDRDWLMATAYALRDQIVDRWLAGIDSAYQNGSKRVYYLSLEFLIGRLLFDNLNNLNQLDLMRAALAGLDVDLDKLRAMEPDAALGNGGLGRLAACFMESMATLDIPAHGYGIRYEHGLFRQVMKNGWQQEYPEDWLALGNPWEFHRPDVHYEIGFGGAIEAVPISEAAVRHVWHPAETIEAVAYDTPAVGWRGRRVNTLRLWSAHSADPLRLDAFNHGDHAGALAEQVKAESISKVLYPSDATPAGQELRLRQEYFFVSASLQDLVRRHFKAFGHVASLPDKTAIQLNDTHPAIGIAEMMRILLDVHQVPWEDAWRMTQAIFSYTNHTLLPEALEVWPVPLMERLLPRHMQIIYLINALHLGHVRKEHPNDEALLTSVSIIDEQQGRRVRMSHLAFLGSHRVNGVSALHTGLMRQTVFRDLHELYSDRIVNVTNGIAFRRWLHEANPRLTRLLVDAAGPEVLDDENALTKLRPLANDRSFQKRFAASRYVNKLALSDLIRRELEVRVDPSALFDVHVKRIHEYKRQLLNILEAIALYNAIRARPMDDWTPRVKIFAGKAAASYQQAKLIIKLIHDVARVINSDPTVRNVLKIVFLPNYSVSMAEVIIPAADVSEQISTAGMEASGTGNMKFALNGALTIGTLDGANIEILEHVGAENMFIFGLTAEQVAARRGLGSDLTDVIAASPVLAQVLASVESGVFSPDEPDRYRSLVDQLRYHDYFLVCADFDDYYAKQRMIADLWRRPEAWWQAAILNTANVGWFSSDRAIREYADLVWNVPAYVAP